MAQVKIYLRREDLETRRTPLSCSLQEALSSVLGLPPEKRFQRFLALDAADFIAPLGRSGRYTIIEIQLFAGRSAQTLSALIREVQRRWVHDLNEAPDDLELVLLPLPPQHWGIRGQLGHELPLGYRVEI